MKETNNIEDKWRKGKLKYYVFFIYIFIGLCQIKHYFIPSESRALKVLSVHSQKIFSRLGSDNFQIIKLNDIEISSFNFLPIEVGDTIWVQKNEIFNNAITIETKHMKYNLFKSMFSFIHFYIPLLIILLSLIFIAIKHQVQISINLFIVSSILVIVEFFLNYYLS